MSLFLFNQFQIQLKIDPNSDLFFKQKLLFFYKQKCICNKKVIEQF